MNNRFTSLLRKELLDAVRDKRSVMAGLYYAFFTPVLLAVVLTAVINKATNPEDIEIPLPTELRPLTWSTTSAIEVLPKGMIQIN